MVKRDPSPHSQHVGHRKGHPLKSISTGRTGLNILNDGWDSLGRVGRVGQPGTGGQHGTLGTFDVVFQGWAAFLDVYKLGSL